MPVLLRKLAAAFSEAMEFKVYWGMHARVVAPGAGEQRCVLSSRRTMMPGNVSGCWPDEQVQLEAFIDYRGRWDLMGFIRRQCFFGILCWKNHNGDKLKEPIPLAMKMVILVGERRRAKTAAIRQQSAPYVFRSLIVQLPYRVCQHAMKISSPAPL